MPMHFHRNFLLSAKAAHDADLSALCTRNKYTPKSVYKALKRRQRILNRGFGHHVWKLRPEAVNLINAIK